MENANPLLWLAWAAFGTALVVLLWRKYLPLLRGDATEPEATPEAARPAWLLCEDGAQRDRAVRWFPLREGGTTVVGSEARRATPEAAFVFLNAEDIRHDHASLRYDATRRRYCLQALNGGAVLHNNDPVATGQEVELSDGDIIDLGQISRFRFTHHGPE